LENKVLILNSVIATQTRISFSVIRNH